MAPPQELILSSSSSFASSSAPNVSSKRATFAPISSVASASTSSGPAYASSISLHDLTTSSHVHTFKPSGGTALHGLSHVNSRNGRGGLLFGSQEGKALLHVWAWQKDQLHLKLHLPEKLACFEVSPNGIWAAGGTHTGHVYLWEIASGLLLASFDAAYRKINVMQFDGSSAVLVCGSEDSSVSAWSVSRLVDNALANTIPQPFASLTHHTLAVTSLHISHAPFPHCRIFTTSLDGTLKIFSLSPPALLTSFTLPAGQVPMCLAVDPMERYVYLGTGNGEIHLVKLFKRRREIGMGSDEEHGNEVDQNGSREDEMAGLGDQVVAVGGAGLSAKTILVGDDQATAGTRAKGKGKISLGTPITTLALSMSQSHLLSGTSTGEIHLHALPSHTLLRTISTHAGTPVTYLSTILRPADLVGHMSFASLTGGGSSSSNRSEEWPIMECKPFERMRVGRKERDMQEIGLTLGPIEGEEEEMDALDTGAGLDFSSEEAYGYGAVYCGSGPAATEGDNGAAKAEGRIQELEMELAKARSQLKRAKEINDTIWNGIVQKASREAGKGDRADSDEESVGIQDEGDQQELIMID